MTVTMSTRMLRICDRSMTSGRSEFKKCLSIIYLLGIFVVSVCIFVSRVGRQMTWAHTTGTVIDTVETTKHTKHGVTYILYQPVVSFHPEEDTKNESSTETVVTFTSKYGTTSKQNTKYPIGSTMIVLYDPRNYERAEMVNENLKGITVSGTIAGIIALVSGSILYGVYNQASEEAVLAERLYPPGYEIHDDDNYEKSGKTPQPVNAAATTARPPIIGLAIAA